MNVTELAFGLIGVGVLFALCAQKERQERPVFGLGVVLIAVVADAVLHPHFEQPPGIFHPSAFGQSFRLPELLIPIVLAARIAARGMPKRVTPTMLWWGAFAVWYAAGAVVGREAGHRTDVIFFEAKAVIYVVGGLVVTAGVPTRDLLDRLPTWLRWSAMASGMLLLFEAARVTVTVAIPQVPLRGFGMMGADVATIFAGFGIMAVALAAAERSRRSMWLMTAAPLLLAPMLARQRAALLGLVVSIVIMLFAWMRPRGHRGLAATPTEVALLGLLVVGMLAAVTIVPAAIDRSEQSPLLLNELENTLQSQGKRQSAESRANQWREAIELISEHPVMGWGLGREYRYYEQGPDELRTSNITHNLLLDVMIRSGVTGLLLLLVALAVSIRGGIATLLRAEPMVVALVLGALAFAGAILVKGLVESIFEKYLLATMLGLLLGMIRAAQTGSAETRTEPTQWSEVVPTWS